MKASDIIKEIYRERGMDSVGEGILDLVPLNDLNVHRKEIWNLSITNAPEYYFLEMNKTCRNKACYNFKFPISDLEEAIKLCKELSENFGTPPCEMLSLKDLNSSKSLFLAVHIHPEFNFTAKTNKKPALTQELVLNFV